MYAITLRIPYGLYGIYAIKLNQICTNFKGSIYIENQNKRCNAKRLLEILSLGIKKNELITISTNSEKHYLFFEEIEKLIN